MSKRKYRGKGLKSYEREPLSREEIRELIQAPDKLRDRLIIALLYDTGLRTSELADLFVSRYGKGLRSDEIRKIVHKAAEQTKIIHGVTPRVLRHSFATHATGK